MDLYHCWFFWFYYKCNINVIVTFTLNSTCFSFWHETPVNITITLISWIYITRIIRSQPADTHSAKMQLCLKAKSRFKCQLVDTSYESFDEYKFKNFILSMKTEIEKKMCSGRHHTSIQRNKIITPAFDSVVCQIIIHRYFN